MQTTTVAFPIVPFVNKEDTVSSIGVFNNSIECRTGRSITLDSQA